MFWYAFIPIVMAKNKLIKLLFFIFAVMTHCAITILLFIARIKIDLDNKHKVKLNTLREFYATVIKILEDVFSFPLFQAPALLESLFFLKGIPALIAATLVNSFIQVYTLYFLFFCLCKCTLKNRLCRDRDDHETP
jgi:hypothetical protein